MATFLEDVILDLKSKHEELSEFTFILPSKRAGTFFTSYLAKHTGKTQFAPEILSIEEFVETMSGIKSATNVELIFILYEVYLEKTPKEQIEPFDKFSKWAQMILQDFNEIDRYLVPPASIFEYLTAIKEMSHWANSKEPTEVVKNYISFWKRLKSYYQAFIDELSKKGIGYQGMIYRKATENLENYIHSQPQKKHIFVGFNALNKAEETIIHELLKRDLASIYWDIDKVFMDNPIHDAGLFMRQFKKNWSYFQNHPFHWVSEHYRQDKNIEVIGTPKNVGQVKYIGEILQNLKNKSDSLSDVAVVLGNENLLLPLLNSLPKNIDKVNITMGLPLDLIPIASLFEMLFQMHKKNESKLYYQEVIAILTHQNIKPLMIDNGIDISQKISKHIQENNIYRIQSDEMFKIANGKQPILHLLFGNWDDNPSKAITNCSELIFLIKEKLSDDKSAHLLTLEYLYRFHGIFNQLHTFNESYKHINSINILYNLYKELLKSETLDFKGEPLEGIQMMGMLESRVLDFETVIIASVNEGILPAGKTQNSFIPFDVKIENKLPTYKEKDAVYTYHFYRLLQRAKNIFLLYNTEADVLNGGEKSRFITQMEIENIHNLNEYIVAPSVPPLLHVPKTIKKTDKVLEKIRNVAEKGFSPSSLTNYIRNPMGFYYEKILDIKTMDEVEETVAANTLGNVIHRTLEDFFRPRIGQILEEIHIQEMKSHIEVTVQKHFQHEYKKGDISRGKNLIIFEIAKRFIHNLLNKELEAIQAGHVIKILGVEEEFRAELPIPELDFPIFLKGNVDRIDEVDGVVRIIDYKTGKVNQNQVEIVNWEDITTDYKKYSKSFQILAYAYMMTASGRVKNQLESGIISFKNLQGNHFLKFAKKDKTGNGAVKEHLITDETLESYFQELKKLILEICNPQLDFEEKQL